MENVVPDLDPVRLQAVIHRVMERLDLLVEEGFTEVEVVGALILISSKLSEALEEVIKDGDNYAC